MRSFIMFLFAICIVGGTYVYTYGVPPQIQAYLNDENTVEAEAASAAPQARDGRPGGRGGRGSAETTVATSIVRQESYQDILNAIGSAVAIQSADVISDVSGRVVEINLGANTEVEAGDVLASLESRDQEIDLTIATAELQQAVETLNRYERLLESGSSTITTVALSDARTAFALATARAELAKSAVEDRTIRAPISGKLGLSDVNVGDVLSNGQAVVSIDNTSSLLVEFELPERAIGILGGESKVQVSTPSFDGRVFDGTITAFDSRVDSVTRSVTVRAEIANDDGLLWSGMSFAVTLSSQGDEGHVVPSTAIVWSRAGSSIWVADGTTARSVPVTIIHRSEDRAWIDADIVTGTQVVVEGTQKLRAGSTIKAVPIDEETEIAAAATTETDANARPAGGQRPEGRPARGGTRPDGTSRREGGQRPSGGERPARATSEAAQ